MTIDQLQYAVVIPNQFLDNLFQTYFIPIKLDAIYKLADTKKEKLVEEKKFCHLQVIKKLMHLYYVQPEIVFLVYKLTQFLVCPYLIAESALQKIFAYIKYIMSFGIRYGGKQIYSDLNYFIVDHNIVKYAGTSKKEDIQAFADTNYTSDSMDSKFCCKDVFTISGDAICFNSIK